MQGRSLLSAFSLARKARFKIRVARVRCSNLIGTRLVHDRWASHTSNAQTDSNPQAAYMTCGSGVDCTVVTNGHTGVSAAQPLKLALPIKYHVRDGYSQALRT